jgi:hypothetical protein
VLVDILDPVANFVSGCSWNLNLPGCCTTFKGTSGRNFILFCSCRSSQHSFSSSPGHTTRRRPVPELSPQSSTRIYIMTLTSLGGSTHTLLAHLVTFLPSFKQSISPLPLLSLLHCMKSSLYGLHLAPMKKLADSNGAELLPISVTGGISAGRGVVSMRVV